MNFKKYIKSKNNIELTINDFRSYDKIRLYYISLEEFKRTGDILTTRIGQTFGISSPFKIPEGMTLEDACKVISYLSLLIEKKHNLEPASQKSVAMVSNILQ